MAEINRSALLARYGICVFVLTASFVLLPLLVLAVAHSSPSFGIPRVLGNLLFFWPQYFLLPGGIEVRETGARLLEGWSSVVSVALWLVLVGAYAWATHRWKLLYVLLGLLPSAAIVLELVLGGLLGMAGFGVVLDGP